MTTIYKSPIPTNIKFPVLQLNYINATKNVFPNVIICEQLYNIIISEHLGLYVILLHA